MVQAQDGLLMTDTTGPSWHFIRKYRQIRNTVNTKFHIFNEHHNTLGMRSVGRIFCRSYASHVKPSRSMEMRALVERAQKEARRTTAPKAVRERYAARGRDKITDGKLTPTETIRYKRALALGKLMDKNGHEPTPGEWIAKINQRRNRIRGISIEEQEDGKKKVDAMGQKIYLPNIIFRLVPNHTPPGQPYNPFEATFRIPQSITKTDIRSYLLSVYGVETTFIRTDNYLSPIYRAGDGSWTRKKAHKTYKRAVVGLVKPFYYPLRLESMTESQRAERVKWIEESFGVQSAKNLRKAAFIRMTRKGSKNWKWRDIGYVKRSQILKAVADARSRREQALVATKQLMVENRSKGLPVDAIDSERMRELASAAAEEIYHRRAPPTS